MKKKISMLIPFIVLLYLASIAGVLANPGIIIITPWWPTEQNSPATFTISTNAPNVYDLQILLVMSVESYNGLPDSPAIAVDITWSGDGGGSVQFVKTDFMLLEEDGVVKIPDATESEKRYELNALLFHLGVPSPNSVYWAMKPFPIAPGGVLNNTPLTFVVTLHSSSPRMTVYALGKETESDTKYNIWVPPTKPGFVVPEAATIVTIAASMAALIGSTVRKRKITA